MASSQRNTVILVALLTIALLGALYYYVVLPKTERVASLQSTITTLTATRDTALADIAAFDAKDLDAGTLARLQKQVPKERGVEYILRDLEDIEMLTRSRIENISFSEYDEPMLERKLGLTETTEEELAAQLANETVEEEEPLYNAALAEAPEGLQIITYQVELLTPDYKTLRTFIREVEGLERIIKIDVVQLSQPGEEVKFAEVVDYTVSASLQLTTFFYNE
ncbi:hypothetical protein CH76_01075 [Lysinibacillus sp. BF-4]|uniref:hypothetical protein n=1 Tax=Lysinibacillus sp. BF-4 TaxID=1473546 RepID=UPI0005014458|nr:hypothetical protein [Lysinibacillus sp. BF-4]KFL44432.1 hypothetical protein CH76_01075 [Lysinibacillus sp. BF-4]